MYIYSIYMFIKAIYVYICLSIIKNSLRALAYVTLKPFFQVITPSQHSQELPHGYEHQLILRLGVGESGTVVAQQVGLCVSEPTYVLGFSQITVSTPVSSSSESGHTLFMQKVKIKWADLLKLPGRGTVNQLTFTTAVIKKSSAN